MVQFLKRLLEFQSYLNVLIVWWPYIQSVILATVLQESEP